ncbi:Unknown protein, partial [Striga hermonthica]
SVLSLRPTQDTGAIFQIVEALLHVKKRCSRVSWPSPQSLHTMSIFICLAARLLNTDKVLFRHLHKKCLSFPFTFSFQVLFLAALSCCAPELSSGREPDHQELPQATVVALFRDYHLEKFSGQGDPRVADEWVQVLEIIFEVMNCPDRYRMLCAQIQLTGDARLWWQAYWSMRPGEKDGCTWDQFKELIREKYYPSYYRAAMERQFLALTQGTRTVDEYEREFTRLGAF